ncbi:hypothetical protein LP420_33220 [Massilia sp. B-10]|nr:hypothetical protein LP420_33220 [Massilia sp. B-10]
MTLEQGFALAKKYFAAIPKRDTPPAADFKEPLNTAEKRVEQFDTLAQVLKPSPPRGRCLNAAARTRRQWPCWASCWPTATPRSCTRAWSRAANCRSISIRCTV